MTNNVTFLQKNNLRLFPIYQAFSYDLLFYYVIYFLFLTQKMGLSSSEVMLGEAFYPVFKVLLQIPCVTIVDKIGKKTSIILGNLLLIINVLIVMFSYNVVLVILSNFFCAFGFVLKELSESGLLDDSISVGKHKGNLFGKLESRGNSFWFVLDAIFSLCSGFLYVINPYLPLLLCILTLVISTFLATRFTDFTSTSISTKKMKKGELQIYLKDLKSSFRFIFKSKRLKSLLLCTSLFSSIIGLISTLRSSILLDIGLPEEYFGVISAALGICAAIAASKQSYFHNKYKNKTLSRLATYLCSSFIIVGLCVICGFSFEVVLVVVTIGLFIQIIVKAPYSILYKRYLNSFTTPSIKTKIYSAHSLIGSIIRSIVSFAVSALLSITSTAYTMTIIGCIFSIGFVFVFDYMKSRVGLKPEEYKKSDIEYVEVK